MYSMKRSSLDDVPPTLPERPTRLLDQLRRHMREGGYAWKTEKTYIHWIKRYIHFHGKQHPQVLTERHLEDYLSYLAVDRNCSPATQRIALNALIYLYTRFFGIELTNIQFRRARLKPHLPVVLVHAEVVRILEHLGDRHRLTVELLYGSGLRLNELLNLRVKDLDFELMTITVRAGKGDKDRNTMLPASVIDRLSEQKAFVATLHQRDIEDGFGEVYMPNALARKYPSAARELGWQFLFPASRIGADPRSGVLRRHHVHETSLRKAVSKARKAAGIIKPVRCHTFRHSFATRLLQQGYDLHTIQKLLGHSDVKTTEIYTHVLGRGAMGVRSPLDHP